MRTGILMALGLGAVAAAVVYTTQKKKQPATTLTISRTSIGQPQPASYPRYNPNLGQVNFG